MFEDVYEDQRFHNIPVCIFIGSVFSLFYLGSMNEKCVSQHISCISYWNSNSTSVFVPETDFAGQTTFQILPKCTCFLQNINRNEFFIFIIYGKKTQ